jgi:hypothetical protein
MAEPTTAAKSPETTGGAGNMDRALPTPFKVVSVEKIDAPEGGEGLDWHRYVLDSGRSKITGQRRGSLEDVTSYAAHFAEQLNSRGLKSQPIWSPRGRKSG